MGDTVAVIDQDALREHLDAANVWGPINHPGANMPDCGYGPPEPGNVSRWNGWNDTVAVGTDSTGRPVVVGLHHYASGHVSPWAGYAGQTPRLSGADITWVTADFEFPLYLLPAHGVINHPEHTPRTCRQSFLGEDHRIHWCTRMDHPATEAHAVVPRTAYPDVNPDEDQPGFMGDAYNL